MSCIVYVHDDPDKEWEKGALGGSTRFWDPPTEKTYDVQPKGGRLILMDQDISHTVVAPAVAAGLRPRYSLVWKLVLHPTVPDQNMKDLNHHVNKKGATCWLEPMFVGSAAAANEKKGVA